MRFSNPEQRLHLTLQTNCKRRNRTLRKTVASDMNTTANGSNCTRPLNSSAEKVGKAFAYSLILVVSLVGNSLVGIIVFKTKTLRKPINLFIVNMAMSDLLYPVFYFPWFLTRLYVDSELLRGSAGHALCKLAHFISFTSSVVSIQTLILIAVDRFGAVVFPLRSPLISSKLCAIFILATWIVAMVVVLPYTFAVKLVEYHGELVCLIQRNKVFEVSPSHGNYFLAMNIVFLYIPIALLSILYFIILIKLKSQKIPGEQSVSVEEQRAKRNRKVLKMAVAIVLGFVLCWVPLSTLTLLIMFAWDGRLPCGKILFWSIASFMSSANCAINPCICFIFSGNYRQGLKRLLGFACLHVLE